MTMRLARSPVAPKRTKIVGPGSADAVACFLVAMTVKLRERGALNLERHGRRPARAGTAWSGLLQARDLMPVRARHAGRPQILEPVDPGQRGEETSPDQGNTDGDQAAADHRRYGTDQRRRHTGLERAQLIGRADEHHLDRRDAAA